LVNGWRQIQICIYTQRDVTRCFIQNAHKNAGRGGVRIYKCIFLSGLPSGKLSTDHPFSHQTDVTYDVTRDLYIENAHRSAGLGGGWGFTNYNVCQACPADELFVDQVIQFQKAQYTRRPVWKHRRSSALKENGAFSWRQIQNAQNSNTKHDFGSS